MMQAEPTVEPSAQFAPEHAMIAIIFAIADLAGQAAAIDEETLPGGGELGIGGASLELGIAQADADEQAPVRRKIMLQGKLVAGRGRDVRAETGFAEEPAPRHGFQIVAQGENAAIERHLLTRRLQFVDQAGARTETKQDGRKYAVTLGLDRVAETIGGLIESDEPHCGEIGRG